MKKKKHYSAEDVQKLKEEVEEVEEVEEDVEQDVEIPENVVYILTSIGIAVGLGLSTIVHTFHNMTITGLEFTYTNFLASTPSLGSYVIAFVLLLLVNMWRLR
jgi:uncharacterized membrane protein